MGLFSGITDAIKGVSDFVKPIADIVDPFGGLISGGMTLMGANSANSANAEQADLNRQFQARMRATQYQTSVSDLKAAGLNPMLAYQQGGSGNLSGAVSAPMQNALGQSVSSGNQARQMLEQNKLLSSQADTQKTQQALNASMELKAQEEAKLAASNARTVEALRPSQILLNSANAKNAIASAALSGVTSSGRSLENQLKSYEMVKHKSDFDVRSSFGGDVARQAGTFLSDAIPIFKLFGR